MTLDDYKRRATGETLEEISFLDGLGSWGREDETMAKQDRTQRTIRCLEGYLTYRERVGWGLLREDLVRGFAVARLRALRAILAAAASLLLLVQPAAGQDVTVLAVKRALQSQATTVGPGLTLETTDRRYKTIRYEISGTGEIRAECSIDGGLTFDVVLDTTYDQADGCNAAPNRCLLDIPASCSHIRTPITVCTGCTISSFAYAER